MKDGMKNILDKYSVSKAIQFDRYNRTIDFIMKSIEVEYINGAIFTKYWYS